MRWKAVLWTIIYLILMFILNVPLGYLAINISPWFWFLALLIFPLDFVISVFFYSLDEEDTDVGIKID